MPRRPWSYRGIEVCIISIPQQASAKVRGQTDPLRAQTISLSMVVTAYSATLIGLTSETAKLGDFTPSVGGLNMSFWRLGGRDWVLPDAHRR